MSLSAKQYQTLCVLAVVWWGGEEVASAQVQWPANGHYYEVIDSSVNWTDACTLARGASFEGFQGHLVTITSQEEADFVVKRIQQAGQSVCWAGGYQPVGSAEPAADWSWVTGETWSFEAWGGNEPNNLGCGGDVQEDNLNVEDNGGWNDVGWCVCRSYVIEYETGDFPCPSIEFGACACGTCVAPFCGDTGLSCGDGVCSGGETPCTCPSDCGVSCGDGCCGGGETPCTCPSDCCEDGTCDCGGRSRRSGMTFSALKPVKAVSNPAPPVGFNRDPADQSIPVIRGQALVGPKGATSSSHLGSADVGGVCNCDSDCGPAIDDCHVVRCNNNVCVEKTARPGTACDDADGLFCTMAECGTAANFGVCVALFEDANQVAGRLSVCPGECAGGSASGKDCEIQTDCPGGRCLLRPGGVCNDTDDRCELDTGVGRCCGPDGSCLYVTESDCDAFNGFWLRIADPDDLLHACYCPIYSSGVAPLDDLSAATDMGTVVRPAFACQGSIDANDNPPAECESVHGGRDCPRRCSGGADDNEFCTTDSDCADGAPCALDVCVDVQTNCHGLENLGDDYAVAGGSHLRLTEFRFAGGVDNPGDSLLFEFWDNSDPPKRVRAFVTAEFEDSGNRLRTFQLDCSPHCSPDEQNPPEQPNDVPFIIPSSGFVTMSSIINGDREDDTTSGHWLATDNVQVGVNDPDVLWKNDVRDDSDPLATKRLIFELVGEVIDAVSGACCDVVNPPLCEDTFEWACRTCQQDSGPPVAPGTVCNENVDCERGNLCLDDAWQGPETKAELDGNLGQDCASGVCNTGTCCLPGGSCIVTDPATCEGAPNNGTFGTAGADCERNCCPQPVATGGDCCDDRFLCTNGGSIGPNGTCSTTADCDSELGRCTDSPDLICSVAAQDCLDASACINTGAGANTCELCIGATSIDLDVPSFLAGGTANNPTSITVDITGDNTVGRFGIEQGDTCSSGTEDVGWYEKFKIEGQCEAAPFDGTIVTGECDFEEQCAPDEQCIGGCAIVTISTCCSSPIVSPVLQIIRDVSAGCACDANTPTLGPISDPDGQPRRGFGAACDHDTGPNKQPCCTDTNFSIQYALPAGDYLYQISRGRFCQNSLDTCSVDDDCVGTPCEANASEYQAHITVSPCYPAACCTIIDCTTDLDCQNAMDISDATCDTQNGVCNAGCLQRNQLECEDKNGTWLGNLEEELDRPSIVVCSPDSAEANNVCKTGSCCEGSGDCNTILDTTAACLTTDPTNVYVGNLVCDDNPCPICPVNGPSFCQESTYAARFITISDRSTTPPFFRADNFTPSTHFISEICWSPAFLQIEPSMVECSAPRQTPPDDWRLRIYEDDFGLPGVERGVPGGQTLEILAKEARGGISRVWDYSARVPVPIPADAGECFWLELTGLGEGGEGCLTFLSESVVGDGQSLGDDGTGYGPEDLTVFRGLSARTPLDDFADVAFCLDGGTSGTACGVIAEAPCVRWGTGSPVCAVEDYQSCVGLSDDAGGYVFAGEPACGSFTPPPIPSNDDCNSAAAPIVVVNNCESPGDCELTFDSRGASTDGPQRSCWGIGDGGGTDADNDFVHDIWYSYIPTCSGVMTLDTCGSNYATQVALYDGDDDTCECPPTDASLITCDAGNDNDNQFGVNDPDNDEPNFCPDPFLQPVSVTFFNGSVIRENVLAWRCYLIRAGGFRGAIQDRWGEGELHIRMECSFVEPVAKAPAPHDILKNRFISFKPNNAVPIAVKVEKLDWACSVTGKQCASDAECTACVCGDNAGDPCTVGNQCPGGSCEQTVETCEEQSPPIMLGWVGVPFEPTTERTPAGTWAANVEKDMPPLTQFPDAVIHVGDCEIAPAQVYGLSASPDGTSFAPMVAFRTIVQPQDKFWGDLVGNFTGVEWTPPNNIVGVDDILSIIKFLTLKPAPHITRVDLGGETPNFLINVSDLQLAIAGFKAKPYPPAAFAHQGPVEDCP